MFIQNMSMQHIEINASFKTGKLFSVFKNSIYFILWGDEGNAT